MTGVEVITGGTVVLATVVKDHTGPVVVLVPSLTVQYHSYSVEYARPGQTMFEVVPEVTPLCVPIRTKSAGADPPMV